MKVMIFDGSMEELLIAVYKVYLDKMDPILYRKEDYVMNLIEEPYEIAFCDEQFQRVRKSMTDKFLSESLNTISYALKHQSRESPTLVLRYIIACFKNPKEGINYQDSLILKVIKMARQVQLESHRFTGFVRFSVVDGLYVSKISPDHDVLEFIAPHFTDRYRDQRFIIYDEKRHRALFSQDGQSLFRNGIDLDEKLLQKDAFTSYWMQYYKHISIQERKNPSAQKRSMPLRYWNNLVETQEGEASRNDKGLWNPVDGVPDVIL